MSISMHLIISAHESGVCRARRMTFFSQALRASTWNRRRVIFQEMPSKNVSLRNDSTRSGHAAPMGMIKRQESKSYSASWIREEPPLELGKVDGLQLNLVAAEWLQRVCLKIKAEEGTFHLQ